MLTWLYMELVEIYRCLCDETRLRILHLLAQGPLCVCHFQAILKMPQVAVSKHLAYLRRRGLVAARRHEQWMIYRLLEPHTKELQLQIGCLQTCAETVPLFKDDLKRLKRLSCECDWVRKLAPGNKSGVKHRGSIQKHKTPSL